MEFQQEDFEFHDLYSENSYLRDIVRFYAGETWCGNIEKDLARFSKLASGELLQLMRKAEKNQPELVQYDHWGRRVDQVVVDPAWDELHRVAAREGMVAIGYERESGEASRLHQFLKLMIFHPSSAFYTCPLAMTDGAARILQLEEGPLKKQFFENLVSRDPEKFWTAGQWMTEKAGGSDVSRSETRAEEDKGRFYLHGTKWFTSAITANLAMALAQTNVGGKDKLSLFIIQIRDEKGNLNNIEVLRLKDKLGTKAMPTAELRLMGAEGFLVGELGQGVKNIATILNISRLYNSVCATGTIYRLHSLIRDYSKKRKAFGKNLIDHPLHLETLIKAQADTNACLHFVSEVAMLLGRSESGSASDEQQAALRLLTPIAKLWTAKKSVGHTSELIEAFGGAGYIEDTGLPRFLRDAQVFSIWEGTTNIMSLDTLRAMSKGDVFAKTLSYLQGYLNESKDGIEKGRLENLMGELVAWVKNANGTSKLLELGARSFSFALGDLFAGILMLRFAEATKNARDHHLASIFIEQIVFPHFGSDEGRSERNKETLLS